MASGFTRLRAQSHETAPISDTGHKWGTKPTYISAQQNKCSGIPLTFPLGLITQLEQLTELRKAFYLLLLVYYKRHNTGNCQMEEMHAARYGDGSGGGMELPHHLCMYYPLSTSVSSPRRKLFESIN